MKKDFLIFAIHHLARVAAILALTITLGCATTTQSSPDADLKSIEKIRDLFIESARNSGFTLPSTPAIREWTRPSLISWRKEANAVAVPKWEELSPDARSLVVTMAGEIIEPKRLFDLLFRWFLVSHELTHAFQDAIGAPKICQ